jgi:valyl-tRNA synthetase
LDDILALMIKKRILPNYEVRNDVITYGRNKSARLMLAENYDEAAEIDTAVDILFVSMQDDLRIQHSAEQTQVLQNRLVKCKSSEMSMAQYWSDKEAQLHERSRERLEALRIYHTQERELREQDWEKPTAKIPFLKPSADLLQIRQQQKASALLHDFANAKAMKLEAEARERSEAMEGAKRFEAARRIDLNLLIERQQREIECLIASSDAAIVRLHADKEKSLLAAERTRKSIELRIATPMQMKHGAIRVPLVKQRAGSGVMPPGMITVRTRTSLAAYRRSAELKRLVMPMK